MSRGELARRIGEVCRDIIGTAPVPAPFTYDDVKLAKSLLRVVTAWNTHGYASQLDPVALAYWQEWHDGIEGGAMDAAALSAGALDMDQRVADSLSNALPDDWEPVETGTAPDNAGDVYYLPPSILKRSTGKTPQTVTIIGDAATRPAETETDATPAETPEPVTSAEPEPAGEEGGLFA